MILLLSLSLFLSFRCGPEETIREILRQAFGNFHSSVYTPIVSVTWVMGPCRVPSMNQVA